MERYGMRDPASRKGTNRGGLSDGSPKENDNRAWWIRTTSSLRFVPFGGKKLPEKSGGGKVVRGFLHGDLGHRSAHQAKRKTITERGGFVTTSSLHFVPFGGKKPPEKSGGGKVVRGFLHGDLGHRSAHQAKRIPLTQYPFCLVGDGGFGPPKSVTTDLQSAPFGRSGNPPYGAGERSRTINRLITNQVLCH